MLKLKIDKMETHFHFINSVTYISKMLGKIHERILRIRTEKKFRINIFTETRSFFGGAEF